MAWSNRWKLIRQVMTGDTDDMEFLSGYELGIFYGLTYDRTLMSVFTILRSTMLNTVAMFHYGLVIILHHADHDLLSLIELFHYLTLYYSVLLINLITVYKSDNTKSFCELLEKEFDDKTIELSLKQLNIKKDSNKLIATLFKIIAIFFFGGLVGSYVRRPILEAAYTKYPIPYIGWLPFEIDNLAKCIAVYIFQAIITVNVVSGHYCFIVSFAIQANHLISQCNMLAAHLDETMDSFIERKINESLEKEVYIASRLKEAIKKHQLLIRCFKLLQDLYSSSLLAMGLASGLLFCSLIYMLTDPDSSVYMMVTASSLLIPEFILMGLYCWFGQRITDKWENIKDTIYNIEWYTQSITTKKTLLLIMTMCTRDKVIKGGGLQEFSMKGFSELLQAGFSSYNMLKALR